MPLYRCDVQIAGTAYIRADTVQEATRMAKRLKDRSPQIEDSDGDVPISGLAYDNPDLPDLSLSPAMTIHGIWPGEFPSLAD